MQNSARAQIVPRGYGRLRVCYSEVVGCRGLKGSREAQRSTVGYLENNS